MSASTSLLGRLSLMMFLQYAVWGAWLPLASRYLGADPAVGGLGFDGGQIGWILGLAGSVGAVTGPFVAGQLADRYFSTERFLALLLLIGGGVQLLLASETSFGGWLGLSVAYSVVYMPTIALSNSLAFAHLDDEEGDFPKVRLWGTIGWITASWTFPMIFLQQELAPRWMPPFLVGPEVEGVTAQLAGSLRFSAWISFAYAAYCLTLPHTPPKRDAVEPLAFRRAFGLLRHPSFAVLVACSLAIGAIHQIYFLQTGPFLSSVGVPDSSIGPAMTVGQFSEILVLGALGWMLKNLGFRTVIWIGGMAYVARYGIWGFVDLPVGVLVASQALHGLCFSCAFAAAFIYVDRLAPTDARHSAQTVFGILLLGGGPVLGGWLSGVLEDLYRGPAGVDYSMLWWTVALIALVTATVFAMLFRDETRVAARAAEVPA